MSHDPSHDPSHGLSPRDLERRTAAGGQRSGPDAVDEDVETAAREREREGEYVDKDVTSADTHAAEHSYEDKDIPD